jgi:hypothetical protein
VECYEVFVFNFRGHHQQEPQNYFKKNENGFQRVFFITSFLIESSTINVNSNNKGSNLMHALQMNSKEEVKKIITLRLLTSMVLLLSAMVHSQDTSDHRENSLTKHRRSIFKFALLALADCYEQHGLTVFVSTDISNSYVNCSDKDDELSEKTFLNKSDKLNLNIDGEGEKRLSTTQAISTISLQLLKLSIPKFVPNEKHILSLTSSLSFTEKENWVMLLESTNSIGFLLAVLEKLFFLCGKIPLFENNYSNWNKNNEIQTGFYYC